MFELLPHEYISPSDLPSLQAQVESGERSGGKVYGVLVTLRDLVRLKSPHSTETLIPDLSTQDPIDKAHYYANPDKYESIFHTRIAPYVTVIVNGIYWDFRYPRLLTKSQLLALREEGNTNLKVVADISCDVGGSFEFLSHTTSIEKPFYTYVSETDRDVDGVHKSGVVMLGEGFNRFWEERAVCVPCTPLPPRILTV
jgi:alpha-aminoadipic semialdehyde synthase